MAVVRKKKESGADFLGLLTLALPDVVQKGFLAQAKRQDPGERLSSADLDAPDRTMRVHVETYDRRFCLCLFFEGGICGAGRECARLPVLRRLAHTPSKIGPFFREHFECYVGDHHLAERHPMSSLALKYTQPQPKLGNG